MKLQPIDRAALAILAGQLCLSVYVFFFGTPGPLPMHFGLNGQVDRWGDRNELAEVMLALALGSALLYALMPALARGRGMVTDAPGMTYAKAALLAIGVLVTLLFAAMGVGGRAGAAPANVERLSMGFIAAIMVCGGAVMGKVGPNPFVGIRTFWALRSRLAWDRSNRLLGRLWFWFGLAALFATPLAPQPAGNMAVLAGMALTATAAVYESWRVWRIDPDRTPA